MRDAALYVVGLAFGRVRRRRSSGALLAAVGIAIGTAVLIGVLAGTKIAQDRSVSQAVDRIPAASRSVRAVWFGVPVERDQSLSRARRDRALRARRHRPSRPDGDRRSSARAPSAGHFVSLAGVDGTCPVRAADERTAAHARARRRAARCCGSVALGTLPNAPGLRLVAGRHGDAPLEPVVRRLPRADRQRPRGPRGRARASAGRPRTTARRRRRSSSRRGSRRSPARRRSREHLPQLCVGVAARGQARRGCGEIDDLVARTRAARALRSPAGRSGSACRRRQEELRGDRARRDRGGAPAPARRRRGGSVALRVRRARGSDDAARPQAARGRLTWYGARRLAARPVDGNREACRRGRRYARRLGRRSCRRGDRGFDAGAPVGAVLRESVLSPAGLGLAAAVAVIATLVIAVASLDPARARTGVSVRSTPRPSAAVAIVVAALLGGAADESRLAERPGRRPRAAPPARADRVRRRRRGGARSSARSSGWPGGVLHRSVGARLAAVTLGRGPGAAAVTVAFLTLAFALALLAEGYRATLVQAESDQAAFAVPLDIVVREDLKSLVPVLDAAPLARYAALGRRRRRRTGGADPRQRRRTPRESAGSPCSAFRPPETAQLHGWRSDFAGRLAGLARLGGDAPGRRSRCTACHARLATHASMPDAGSSRSAPRSRRPTGGTRSSSSGRSTDEPRRTSTVRCPRGCAAASSSRSSSCRRGSSTAEPTPAARWPAPCGSAASRARRGSARAASCCARPGTVSSSRYRINQRERRAHPRPRRRPTRLRRPCS